MSNWSKVIGRPIFFSCLKLDLDAFCGSCCFYIPLKWTQENYIKSNFDIILLKMLSFKLRYLSLKLCAELFSLYVPGRCRELRYRFHHRWFLDKSRSSQVYSEVCNFLSKEHSLLNIVLFRISGLGLFRSVLRK